MKRIAFLATALVVAFCLVLFGCGVTANTPSTSTDTPMEEPTEPETPEEPGILSEIPAEYTYSVTARWYYDYFNEIDPAIGILIGETNHGEFTDLGLSAYALLRLIHEKAYDYEVGYPKADFDAVLMKYVGRVPASYETQMTTVLPSGNITSTGWGGQGEHYLLSSLEKTGDTTYRAIFYDVPVRMGEEPGTVLESPEYLRARLLSGHLDGDRISRVVELTFDRLTDADGHEYLCYRSAVLFPDAAPYTPYMEPVSARYTREERSAFHEFLRQNLSKDDYSWFDTVTTGVKPYIIVTEGHDAAVDAVIKRYSGSKVEMERRYSPYSLNYLNGIVDTLEGLDCVRNSDRAVSSIGAYEGKVHILLMKELPALREYLKNYPADAIELIISDLPNPTT